MRKCIDTPDTLKASLKMNQKDRFIVLDVYVHIQTTIFIRILCKTLKRMIKFQPKTFKLKTGKSIRVRMPEFDEVQKLIDLKKSYLRNTKTIPLVLDEYLSSVKNELALITEYEKSLNGILLVAEFENEFIGNIDLTGSKRSKMFHTGMIGMGIKEEWRDQGLGRILIESVIDWAKENSEIELIWLDVYASNELGYNLYKNTGFQISGIINDFFKDENGYVDKVQMYQRIKKRII